MRPLMILGIVLLGGVAIAQPRSTVAPDARGDYYQNIGYQFGTVPNTGLQTGYLWQVVPFQLNCRREASLQSKPVRVFRQGALLQADVGRGGSDEVLLNALDGNRKPWMRVRNAAGQDYNCYVRANRQYIVPYKGR